MLLQIKVRLKDEYLLACAIYRTNMPPTLWNKMFRCSHWPNVNKISNEILNMSLTSLKIFVRVSSLFVFVYLYFVYICCFYISKFPLAQEKVPITHSLWLYDHDIEYGSNLFTSRNLILSTLKSTTIIFTTSPIYNEGCFYRNLPFWHFLQEQHQWNGVHVVLMH